MCSSCTTSAVAICVICIVHSELRQILNQKLLTTHLEEERKKEHIKQVTERQLLAQQQIAKLEAELADEQAKKEKLVSKRIK